MKTILIFLILLFNISLNAQYYKIYKHLKDSTYKIDSTKKDSVKIIVNNYYTTKYSNDYYYDDNYVYDRYHSLYFDYLAYNSLYINYQYANYSVYPKHNRYHKHNRNFNYIRFNNTNSDNNHINKHYIRPNRKDIKYTKVSNVDYQPAYRNNAMYNNNFQSRRSYVENNNRSNVTPSYSNRRRSEYYNREIVTENTQSSYSNRRSTENSSINQENYSNRRSTENYNTNSNSNSQSSSGSSSRRR